MLALTFPVWQKHLQHFRQIGIRWVEESIEEGSVNIVNRRWIDLVAVFRLPGWYCPREVESRESQNPFGMLNVKVKAVFLSHNPVG